MLELKELVFAVEQGEKAVGGPRSVNILVDDKTGGFLLGETWVSILIGNDDGYPLVKVAREDTDQIPRMVMDKLNSLMYPGVPKLTHQMFVAGNKPDGTPLYADQDTGYKPVAWAGGEPFGEEHRKALRCEDFRDAGNGISHISVERNEHPEHFDEDGNRKQGHCRPSN